MSGPLFLGFDLSTQQLKAAIIDQSGALQHESSVHFDRELSKFGTTNGALHGEEPGEVYCPVIVWIEALDLLMDKMKQAGVNFSAIVAISGAAQVSIFLFLSLSIRPPPPLRLIPCANNLCNSNMVRSTGMELQTPSCILWTPPSLFQPNSFQKRFRPPSARYGKTPLQRKNARS